MLFDNHKFTSYFASYRFMKAFGPDRARPAVMAWLRGRLDNAFGIVDKQLRTAPSWSGPTHDRRLLAVRLPVLSGEESGYRLPTDSRTSRRGSGACVRFRAGPIHTTSCRASALLQGGESDSPLNKLIRTPIVISQADKAEQFRDGTLGVRLVEGIKGAVSTEQMRSRTASLAVNIRQDRFQP